MIQDENNRAIINEMKKVVPEKFRRSATSKKSIKLVHDRNGKFHWEGKKPDVKPVIKSFIDTLKIRQDEAETTHGKKFYSEIIRKLTKIVKN